MFSNGHSLFASEQAFSIGRGGKICPKLIIPFSNSSQDLLKLL